MILFSNLVSEVGDAGHIKTTDVGDETAFIIESLSGAELPAHQTSEPIIAKTAPNRVKVAAELEIPQPTEANKVCVTRDSISTFQPSIDEISLVHDEPSPVKTYTAEKKFNISRNEVESLVKSILEELITKTISRQQEKTSQMMIETPCDLIEGVVSKKSTPEPSSLEIRPSRFKHFKRNARKRFRRLLCITTQ